MMLVAIDLDGTLDVAPMQWREILLGLIDRGHRVVVLTGINDGSTPDQTGWDTKVAKLSALGCSDCWHELVMLSLKEPQLADAKAQWLVANGAAVFIDNTKPNVKAATAAGVPLVLRVEN